MNKGVARSLAKIKVVQLGNNILVQGAGFQEVHKLFVEYRLLGCGSVFKTLGKINEKNALQVVVLVRN